MKKIKKKQNKSIKKSKKKSQLKFKKSKKFQNKTSFFKKNIDLSTLK